MTQAIVRAVVLLMLLGVVLFAGVGALGAANDRAVSGSNQKQMVDGESFLVQPGQVVELDKSAQNRVFNGTAVVKQNGSVYEEGGATYRWLEHNGTLYIPDGTVLNGGNAATVDYWYYEPSPAQHALWTIGGLPIRTGEALLIAVAALVLLTALSALTGGS